MKQRLVGSFSIKAKDEGKRTFVGTLATSHLDLGDGRKQDIVWPGAFKRFLGDFRSGSDSYVPLLDSHNPRSILNVFGHMLGGEEVLTGKTLAYPTTKGAALEVPEMFLETEWQVIDGPDGDRILDRLRPGSVRKMSMGYAAAHEDVELKSGPARILREVRVGEGSLVVFPMNPSADVDTSSVKALLETLAEDERVVFLKAMHADIRDPRVLRGLASNIGNLLKNLPPAESPPGEPTPEATPDTADSRKADEDAPDTSALDRLRLARLRLHSTVTR